MLEMGIEISKNISDSKDFMNTINRSFKREKEWVAETPVFGRAATLRLVN